LKFEEQGLVSHVPFQIFELNSPNFYDLGNTNFVKKPLEDEYFLGDLIPSFELGSKEDGDLRTLF